MNSGVSKYGAHSRGHFAVISREKAGSLEMIRTVGRFMLIVMFEVGLKVDLKVSLKVGRDEGGMSLRELLLLSACYFPEVALAPAAIGLFRALL